MLNPEIYMLHRVLPVFDKNNYYFQRGTAISWQRFIDLLDQIEKRQLKTAVISDLSNNQENTVYLTFDDGYKDNAQAFDEILKRGMVATLYPVKNFIETDFSPIDNMAHYLMQYPQIDFDLKQSLISGRLKHLLRKLSVKRYCYLRSKWFGLNENNKRESIFLTTEQLKKYVKKGIELGIHGCSHRTFTTLSKEQLKQELVTAKDWLTSLGNKNHFSICFPHGQYNQEVIQFCLGYSKLLLGVDTKTINPVLRRIYIKEEQ